MSLTLKSCLFAGLCLPNRGIPDACQPSTIKGKMIKDCVTPIREKNFKHVTFNFPMFPRCVYLQ